MVDLLATASQGQLAHSIGNYLEASLPMRRLADSGLDPAGRAEPWTALADLGWLALGVPPASGGLGLSLEEQALVLREFGRVVAPLQVLAAVLGARIAALAGDDDLAVSIGSGDVRVAVIVPDSVRLNACSLFGSAYVVDYQAAGLALLLMPAAAILVNVADLKDLDPLSAFDNSMGLGRASFKGVAPVCLLRDSPIHLDALVLHAAYCAGMCEAICAMASDYAKTRAQFGQPIGAFQAVKHRCADMAIRADAAWSQVVYAALAVSGMQQDAGYQALCARIVANRYAIIGAQENIQLHGAIGTTEELAAHRFLKRAHVMDVCFGSSDQHKGALLDLADPREME